MAIEIIEGIEFTVVLICEDVRQELHNKWGISGIFTSEILVPSVPTSLRLALYCQGNSSVEFNGPLSIRVRLDDNVIMQLNGNYNAQVGDVILAIPNIFVTLPSEGMIFFESSPDTQKWTTLTTKKFAVTNLAV